MTCHEDNGFDNSLEGFLRRFPNHIEALTQYTLYSTGYPAEQISSGEDIITHVVQPIPTRSHEGEESPVASVEEADNEGASSEEQIGDEEFEEYEEEEEEDDEECEGEAEENEGEYEEDGQEDDDEQQPEPSTAQIRPVQQKNAMKCKRPVPYPTGVPPNNIPSCPIHGHTPHAKLLRMAYRRPKRFIHRYANDFHEEYVHIIQSKPQFTKTPDVLKYHPTYKKEHWNKHYQMLKRTALPVFGPLPGYAPKKPMPQPSDGWAKVRTWRTLEDPLEGDDISEVDELTDDLEDDTDTDGSDDGGDEDGDRAMGRE